MNGQDMCSLAAHIKIKSGEKKKIRFLFSWYFPIFEKYWATGAEKFLSRIFLHGKQKLSWKNYYATIFSSSKDVAEYCFKNWNRLQNDTKLFCDTLCATSIPDEVYGAIQGTIAVLKSSTCMRLTDGSFYAFEGTNENTGSCEGTCDHVWGYAYAMPYLFPSLERSIRHTTYTNNITKSGKIIFRTMLPIGSIFWPISITSKHFNACCDAQFGNIIKFYRDWKISGDDEFLKSHWTNVKKSLEFAWDPKNPFKWDIEKTGVINGRQHHTLDVELFGPNSWLSGYYIGALFAMAEMADYLGEHKSAKEYREIALRGKNILMSIYSTVSTIFKKLILKIRVFLMSLIACHITGTKKQVKLSIRYRMAVKLIKLLLTGTPICADFPKYSMIFTENLRLKQFISSILNPCVILQIRAAFLRLIMKKAL